MKTYEVREGKGRHPYFEKANSETEAIQKVVDYLSKNRQSSPRFEDFICVETHKVPLESVMTPFTFCPDNGTDVPLEYLEGHIENICNRGSFIEQPDFQRAHVWTEEQQVKYVEFFLRGGKSGTIIYTNRRDEWNHKDNCSYPTVLVDGLQRLTAVRKFMRGELKVFGNYVVSDFQHIGQHLSLRFVRNNLKTEKEVLQWYVDLNAGGTPHTDEEINKVKRMLENV